MAEKPSKSFIKKILKEAKGRKKKYITVGMLSSYLGVYPDVISDALVYFDPMLKLDDSANVVSLIPEMEEYVKPEPTVYEGEKPKRVVVYSKDVDRFSSIGDFVQQKFTNVGGLVDKSINLSDEDLKILDKLVDREIEARKPKKKRRKAKSRK